MGFVAELKSRANALQSPEVNVQCDLMDGSEVCEKACRMALAYLQALCAQLNVVKPAAPVVYSLDGKVPFPALAQRNFHCDARRKLLRNAEVFGYIGVSWDLSPISGQVATHTVTVNFRPVLDRVAERLSVGHIAHKRRERRHPDTSKLLAYVFEYQTAARAFITLTPNHDTGQIAFRVTNVGGFGVLNVRYDAAQVTHRLMDELAKKLVGRPSRFG